MRDRDGQRFDDRHHRRRRKVECDADRAEVVMTIGGPVIVRRSAGLRLVLRGHRCRRSQDVFGMDMSERQDKLERERKKRCPRTKIPVPSNPVHANGPIR